MFGAYLQLMTRPFFRNWWAALTGLASVMALYAAASWTITLGPLPAASLVFVLFTLVFLVLSVLQQSWELYRRVAALRVISFDRTKDFPEGWVISFEANVEVAVGAIIDIHKRSGAIEVPFALVKVTGKTSSGTYQATPIGRINPAHLKEHAAGTLRSGDLVVRPFVEASRMAEVNNEIR